MRHDSDFAAYLAARWTPVVRCLVLLGAPPAQAEAAARTGFARCCSRWGRLRDAHDLDAEVYRTVLEGWARRTWAEPEAPAAELPLEEILDRLTPDVRASAVLRHVAGLSEVQVAQVLDRPVRAVPDQGRVPDEEAFRQAAEAIDVPHPPIEAVRAESREQRRRTVRLVAASTGVLAVVVGLATWLGTRPADVRTGLGPVPVTRAENPIALAWWANGVLHLEHETLELPPLTNLYEVLGGAVYGDEEGGVLFVADDGTRELLGKSVPGGPIEVSDEQGWAAWVDVGGGAPELVVYDLAAHRVLDSRPVERDSWPVAIDLRTVYYTTPEGSLGWRLPGDATERAPFGLLDVSAGIRARTAGPGRIEFVQPFFSISFVRPGVGAEISRDGNYVLTRTPDPMSTYGTVHVYDTRTGDEIGPGLTASELAVGARLGPDATVTYVVARAEDKPEADDFVRLSFSGPMELRTCSLDTGQCVVDAKFPSTGSAPVLAR